MVRVWPLVRYLAPAQPVAELLEGDHEVVLHTQDFSDVLADLAERDPGVARLGERVFDLYQHPGIPAWRIDEAALQIFPVVLRADRHAVMPHEIHCFEEGLG